MCPICGKKNIKTTNRDFFPESVTISAVTFSAFIMDGLLHSYKTLLKCNSCGYKWEMINEQRVSITIMAGLLIILILVLLLFGIKVIN
jgi:hypothetical protein